MASNTEHDRRDEVEDMLASWRLEGFVPDDDYRALLDRYVAGDIELREMRDELRRRRDAAAHAHQ